MLRIAHLSDVHVFAPEAKLRLRDWFSKRLTGWLNLKLLPRGRRFRYAADQLRILMDDVAAQQPGLIVMSGDATSLGTEAEFALAAQLFGLTPPGTPIPGIAVPGNHDYYTREAADSGQFEKHFQPWLAGDRIAGHTYPFVRVVGEYEFVAVNSSRGNWLWWDATGEVGADQRDRLKQMLARKPAGHRILVTHYPVTLADGRPENRIHRLHDLAETVAVARDGGIGLWLHGHRHHPYVRPPTPAVPFPCICAGSGTQLDCWSYHVYSLIGDELHGERRSYSPSAKRYERIIEFEVALTEP